MGDVLAPPPVETFHVVRNCGVEYALAAQSYLHPGDPSVGLSPSIEIVAVDLEWLEIELPTGPLRLKKGDFFHKWDSIASDAAYLVTESDVAAYLERYGGPDFNDE